VRVSELKQLIQGDVVVLYGRPFVGKSVLALMLSRHFKESHLLLLDANYTKEYFRINPDLKVHYIKMSRGPRDVYSQVVEALRGVQRDLETLVIIDSLTTLQAAVLGPRVSPYDNLLYARLVDSLMLRLRWLKPATSLVIAHEKLLSFEAQELVPRMNMVVLRHVDKVVHLVEEGGKRRIEVRLARELAPDKLQEDYEVGTR